VREQVLRHLAEALDVLLPAVGGGVGDEHQRVGPLQHQAPRGGVHRLARHGQELHALDYEEYAYLQLAQDAKAKEIYAKAGQEFNINSPRQLGDVLFNKMGLPKPVKYGKGKTISTAQDVMDELAPSGPVYQAGTLSGNPLATAAALVVLRRLRDPDVYRRLEETGAALEAGLSLPGVTVQRVGGMLTAFMNDSAVWNCSSHSRPSDVSSTELTPE